MISGCPFAPGCKDVNVLQITAWDTIGERFNGSLIHRALLARGHQSAMAVRFKRGSDPAVFEVGTRLTRVVDNHLLVPLERRLSLQHLLPTSGYALHVSSHLRDAEIIHLQLIHASPFFSLANLPVISRRRSLVWTIHDPWMTTGHCIHPRDCDRWRIGCGKCPDLVRPQPMRRDRTALMWRIKRSLVRRSRPTLVVASHFMRELIAESPILSGLPCRVIPFGVPIDTFKPLDRAAARSHLGLPDDADVIAFRFRGFDDPHKGGGLLADALRMLQPARPTTLLVIEGGKDLPPLGGRFRVVDLGWIESPAELACVFNAADLYLMPSAAEAFGMMAVEAMACGIPVIVCEGTALPEVVMAPEGGLSVPAGQPAALARAIEDLLASPAARHEIGCRAVELAREHYSIEAYVQRHLELYQELLEALS